MQQQQQQNNANMTADRNLLTDKELHYLKDYMSWELLAMKKCQHAAQSCQDPEIQNVIKQIGLKHIQHYEVLLSHLQ
jgi:rRNA maturation endonuclease Nob1